MIPPDVYAAAVRPLKVLREYARWVVFDAHIETLEMWTTVNAILWGAWLFNPWMNVFTITSIYATMALVPEPVWGLTAVVGGCLQLAGRIQGRPLLIRYGARTLAALWMFGGAAIAVSNWRFASLITYPMMAAASLFVSFRAGTPYTSDIPVRWGAKHGDGS